MYNKGGKKKSCEMAFKEVSLSLKAERGDFEMYHRFRICCYDKSPLSFCLKLNGILEKLKNLFCINMASLW